MKRTRLKLLLILLLTGTLAFSCATVPVSPSPEDIVLPPVPVRPVLPGVSDMKTAGETIWALMAYAKEWEAWGASVQQMVEEL